MVANHPTRPRWVTPDSDRRITQLMGATGTKCTGCGFEATNRKSLKKTRYNPRVRIHLQMWILQLLAVFRAEAREGMSYH